MDKKIDTLYDLCEMVYKEIENIKKELENAGGQLGEQHIEYIKDLVETMKYTKCLIGMIEDEEEGYSGNYYYDDDMSMARGGRGGRSNRGSSYARRGSYERGRSNRRSYGRMESRDDFIDEIEELMEKAPDEATRKKFERMLSEMR